MRAKIVSESIDFQRGVDPKRSLNIGAYATIEKLISNPEEVDDFISEIDYELETAMEVYLSIKGKQDIARMWLSNHYESLPNYEFLVLNRDEDDDEDDNQPEFSYEIDQKVREGWSLFNVEDNYGQLQAILTREKE